MFKYMQELLLFYPLYISVHVLLVPSGGGGYKKRLIHMVSAGYYWQQVSINVIFESASDS